MRSSGRFGAGFSSDILPNFVNFLLDGSSVSKVTLAEQKLEEERFYKALQRRQNEQRANLDFEREKLKLQNDQTLFAYDLAERGQRSQMERLQAMERLDAELEDRASERRIKERQQELSWENKILKILELYKSII